MPLFMDVHRQWQGSHGNEVQEVQQAYLEHQSKHDVRFLKYWHDADQGVVFCLTRAPDASAAMAVHKDAGHPPDEIHEVAEREAGPKKTQAAEAYEEKTAESRT